MGRRPALLATTTLTVATALTLLAAGMLGMLEHPWRDVTVLTWLASERAVPAGEGSRLAVPPDPAPPTGDGSSPGPAPVVATASPLAVRIDALDVDAPIVPVGVLPDGAMEVPDDVGTLGWYATDWRRVSPGDTGVAVLAGHRDSRVQGPGALHDIAELDRGARVRVVHLDGTVTTWAVDRILTTPRDQLPGDLLFTTDGPPTLALVSCGGEFDTATRSYTHNTIVLATLVDDRAPAAP